MGTHKAHWASKVDKFIRLENNRWQLSLSRLLCCLATPQTSYREPGSEMPLSPAVVSSYRGPGTGI